MKTNMHLTKQLSVMFFVLLFPFMTSAQVEIGGIWYNLTAETNEAEVTESGDTEYSGSITIPATVTHEGVAYSVTSIGAYAFFGCSSLTSITLPASVTSIGERAFSGCSGELTVNCNIPSASSITSGAFYQSIFTKVNVGSGVTSIGDYAFCDRTSLTSISIPENSQLTSIGAYAFYGCRSLTSITLPASVTSIGKSAFSGCSGELTVNCNIPSASSITSGAFYNSMFIKVNIGSGVTSIGDYAFRNCSSLTSITLPASVTSIGKSAFSGCSGELTVNCNIPSASGITSGAFYNSKFTKVNIGSGVTSIGKYAFYNCSGELTVNCNIPSASSSGSGAFYNSKFTKVNIGSGVTSIGDYTFYDCSSLTSITIPEGVTSIGRSAFSGCSGELTVNCNIPSASSSGSGAFSDSEFTKVNIGSSVTSIGEEAFRGCSSLTSIIIPESVTSIGSSAFSDCSSLTSIMVAEGNAKYDSRKGCNAIIEKSSNTLILGCSSTVIPEGVTSIGERAFYDCKNLTSITIPESVTSIRASVFSGCSSLSSITCHAVVPSVVDYYTFTTVDKSIPVYVPASSVSAYKEADHWKEFTNIQPIVKSDVEILDNVECFEQEINEDCASVTYTRNFRNTNWQALYVPFEIPVTEEFLADFEVADLNDIRQYDRDDNGVADETVVEAFKLTDGTLAANYPYLIRAKEAGEKTIAVTDATLYVTEENSIDCSSIHEKYTFTGTYSTLPAATLTGCYALSGGVWQPLATDASLGAFRFYLKIESRDGNVQAARTIRLRIIGDEADDDATRIDKAESAANGQQPAVVYDLQGRRVVNPAKGIYIVNGKKIMY